MVRNLSIILFFLLLKTKIFGQPLALPIYSKIETFENYYQIDSIKNYYSKNGFIIVKETMLNMENNYESTIIMPLRAGTWYRYIMIGDKTSKSYQARLYDNQEKKLITLNQKPKDAEGSIVAFDFIPNFTEFYLLNLLQINKANKKPFGYLMMFKMQIKLK